MGAGNGLGGGLFNHNGSITVANSTFFGNTAASGGSDIYNCGDSTEKTTSFATATAIINNTIIGQFDTRRPTSVPAPTGSAAAQAI